MFSLQKWGKLFIKEYGFSPDSFLQMALQLAYGKIYGQGCATYETGHTRKYYKGRTGILLHFILRLETVRSFSKESKEFVEAMLTKGVSAQEREEKLAIAAAAYIPHQNIHK